MGLVSSVRHEDGTEATEWEDDVPILFTTFMVDRDGGFPRCICRRSGETKVYKVFGTAILIVTFSLDPSLANNVFLECEGNSRIPGQPPIDSDTSFTVAVDLASRSVQYDGRSHRIYDVSDTKIDAFAKFQTANVGVGNLMSISLDRVSGAFNASWSTTERRSNSEYVFRYNFDDEQTAYDPIPVMIVSATCRPGTRLF